jgi:hypothetical protein
MMPFCLKGMQCWKELRKSCHDSDRSYADILENPDTCYSHDVRKSNY